MFDFVTNKTVDTLDLVPSEHQSLYEPTEDGKFTISAGASALVAAYVGTSSALAEANSKTKSANDESASRRVLLKGYDELMSELGLEGDDTMVAIREHITGLTGQIKGGEAAKVNLDKVNTDWKKRMEEQKTSSDAETAAMRSTLDRYLINQAATAEIVKQKGSVDLLLPILERMTKVERDGDDYVPRIKDKAGDNRLNGSGGHMTMADAVSEMKTNPDLARAFDSEAKEGGGQTPGGGTRKATPQQGEKSANDKISSGLDALKK